MGYFKQFLKLDLANEAAKAQSIKDKEEPIYIIKSTHGDATQWFAESGSPFLRNWETLVGTWENGEFTKTKN